MGDPYDLHEPFLPPKVKISAELAKGFGETLKHVYLCERVANVTRFKLRRTRLWVLTPGVTLLCTMDGAVVRMLPLSSVDKVFVQRLPKTLVIIKPEGGTGEPTQVLELDSTQDVRHFLKVFNALYRAVNDKVLDVEDIGNSVHVHEETTKFGSLAKEFGYRPPMKKLKDWEQDPPELKSYAELEALDPLTPGTSKKDGSPARAFSDDKKVAGSDTASVGDDLYYRRERNLREEAEKGRERAERAANVLAEQLSLATRSDASMVRITDIRTEGLDALVRHCTQCADPITPFCATTGGRHTQDDLILTMFTSREIQHVATSTTAGVAAYDIKLWKPIHVATDRDIFFSWVSGNRLLGKTGVLISDLMPKGQTHSPELLWNPGIVIRLDGSKVGILRVRAEAHEDDAGETGTFMCVAKSGCHALHVVPQDHPVSTISYGEIVMVHETTKVDGEVWGRSGGYWVMLTDSRGERYMVATGSKSHHLWACVAAALSVVAATSLRLVADAEEKSLGALGSRFAGLEKEMQGLTSNADRAATAADLDAIGTTLYARGGRYGMQAGYAGCGPAHPLSRAYCSPQRSQHPLLGHGSPSPLLHDHTHSHRTYAPYERIPVEAPVFGFAATPYPRPTNFVSSASATYSEPSDDIVVSVQSYNEGSDMRIDRYADTSLYASVDDDTALYYAQ
eukprot:TRINITY_DN22815_c0_g1_i1.p1 TRINITY_DN22815_c0_g1~~TRINITY_DN22815_c0_g1_i1.p1  ORF type:complete len:680 (+),score=169.22 TRINITY_DN22815_c0_g1_i1:94-2133(+)